MKTGALLRFGCVAGAILGQADAARWNALDRYGSVLGEAFQIADDLLDLEGDPAKVGKATGKDAAANKATLVGVLGAAAAKRRLDALVTEAERALVPFGGSADVLKAAARFVATRSA
jgi:farnesyl diphosphate synthase